MLCMRMAKYLKKPMFEIEGYPESELAWWGAFFSIEDNKDKPIIEVKEQTVEESKMALREVLS